MGHTRVKAIQCEGCFTLRKVTVSRYGPVPMLEARTIKMHLIDIPFHLI